MAIRNGMDTDRSPLGPATKVALRSRNDKDFTGKYAPIAKALQDLPDDTVIDGELVALDGGGRPSFHTLQNHYSSGAALLYFVFDLLVLAGRDVMTEPLEMRRQLLKEHVLLKLEDPIRESPILNADLPNLIASVRA